MTLEEILPANLFAAALVFVRLGAIIMLLPGFGEAYVPPRFRLLLAVLITGLVAPVLAPRMPPLPASPLGLFLMIGGELIVGLFIGTLTKILMATLETAGQVVSLQSGLAAASIFNPLAAQQGSVTGALYSMLGVLLIFLTDLHHLLLRAAVESYGVFTPGALPPLGDFSEAIARVVAGSFSLAMQMAAPFVVLGIVFSVGLGLIGRLVPQLQITFVAQPLQIVGGLVVFALVLATGMRWFLTGFTEHLGFLVQG